jgi:hypothetical protein
VVGPSRRATETPAPWLLRVAHWLLTTTPEDFGYFSRRWSWETLAEVLPWENGARKSEATIRRGLKRLGFVWRRPRPVVGPVDLDYAEKLQGIRDLLTSMADDETAVFQDEVDTLRSSPGKKSPSRSSSPCGKSSWIRVRNFLQGLF